LTSILVATLAFVAGAFIGAIGIGGIILVSGLIYVAGLSAPTAIAACMFGYLLTGLVGTWVYAREGSISWSMVGWLSLGAMPTAFAGAWATNTVSPALLELGIGLLTAGAGLHALLAGNGESEGAPVERAGPLAAIGAFVGFGSAVTGTGGPLLLVPIMLWLNVPILTAIGLSQAIQLPIATLATIGNAVYGALDLRLAALLAVALAAGSWIGAKVAHLTPRQTLRKVVAVMLAIVGAAIVLRLGLRMIG
jgi:hypothetical protein